MIRNLPLSLQAEAARLLVAERGWSVDAVASSVGLSAKQVRHLMKYLPPDLRGLRDPAEAGPTPAVGTVSASPSHTGPGEPGIFLVGASESGTRMHTCTPSGTHASGKRRARP